VVENYYYHYSTLLPKDPQKQRAYSKRKLRMEQARSLGTHTKHDWLRLIELCGNKCVKCLIHSSQLVGGILSRDHVVPICVGGSDLIGNIQPMCRNCNSMKGKEQVDYVDTNIREVMWWEANGFPRLPL
jgi:5-methylcytosine-specific restriction endonuclease McrA